MCRERNTGEPGENPQRKVRTCIKVNPHMALGWNGTRATLVGGQLLSPLCHPCSPKKNIVQNLLEDLQPLSKLHKDLHCKNLTFDCLKLKFWMIYVFVAVNNVKCQFCDMTCPNASALKQHVKFRHSAERPFKCDVCSYT